MITETCDSYPARNPQVEQGIFLSQLWDLNLRAYSASLCSRVCISVGDFIYSVETRTLSSAGSERVPYKHEVSGSNPLASTIVIPPKGGGILNLATARDDARWPNSDKAEVVG